MPQATNTVTLTIEGMHCGSCALLIDDALADLPGVLTSSTSAKDRRSTVAHDGRTDRAAIVGAIEALGYRAEPTAGQSTWPGPAAARLSARNGSD